MRVRPSNRSDTTSVRKWSPPPVVSSTVTSAPGRARSMRSRRSSALGIQPSRVPTKGPIQSAQMVALTDIAAKKVQEFMSGQGAEGEVGLRVGVKGGGCSGFQYALALDEKRADDHVFEISGIRVLVDPASMQYVVVYNTATTET